MSPQRRYRHPKFLQQCQSRRCCSRQRARSHQSGCPVLPFPFRACLTGQRHHRTDGPVVCSSPDYMPCPLQIFPSIWAFVRSDALVCLASLNINQARRNTMNNDDRLKNVERDGSDQVPALSRPFRNLRSPLLNGECSGACAWICAQGRRNAV